MRHLTLVTLSLGILWACAPDPPSADFPPDASTNLGETMHHGPATNRLAHEKSPYLLQHADNPVDWYPWGEEALQRAREEGKPIFVSIGYSTCHWCHVMERESFEDEDIARILNEHFVSIKIDREERPDLDEIYMTACQLMTGQGGWPLSVFLLPDLRPFFAGTYFPPEDRYGRRGFKGLLLAIADAWQNERGQILESAGKLSEHMSELGTLPAGEGELSAELLARAYEGVVGSYDPQWGGFGRAPKFPRTAYGALSLRRFRTTGDPQALQMATHTLHAMAAGGIYDQLGGGFHRYSTDSEWLAPHFEKMLYDNAQLAFHYAEAFQLTRDPQFERVVRETIGYVLRDMTHPLGGFFSAEDADSEGEEGTFYVWSSQELRELLTEDFELFAAAFDVTEQGNWEGHNILRRVQGDEALADRIGMDATELSSRLDRARATLFAHRETRVRPGLDDKVLTAWNGLMIQALARCSVVFDVPEWEQAATKAARFILENMRDERGLLRRWRDGEAAHRGFAEDYAMFVLGLCELYQASLDIDILRAAMELHDQMFELFGDVDGALFNTRAGEDDLIVRVKTGYDGSVPTANSVALRNCVALFELTGQSRYGEQADRLAAAFAPTLRSNPMALVEMMLGVESLMGERVELVLAGDRRDPKLRRLLLAARSGFHPSLHITHAPIGGGEEMEELLPTTVGKMGVESATAYVCRGFSCRRPTADVDQMLDELQLLSANP